MPIKGIRNVSPCDVRAVPILFEPDSISNIQPICILHEFHSCPFPIVWMSRILSRNQLHYSSPQQETDLLKEHIVHHSPRCIVVAFPDCIICRTRSRELSLLRLFRLRGTALIKWPKNHTCIFREVLRLASVWLYCCCGEASLGVKVPQRRCRFDSSERFIDED